MIGPRPKPFSVFVSKFCFGFGRMVGLCGLRDEQCAPFFLLEDYINLFSSILR